MVDGILGFDEPVVDGVSDFENFAIAQAKRNTVAIAFEIVSPDSRGAQIMPAA